MGGYCPGGNHGCPIACFQANANGAAPTGVSRTSPDLSTKTPAPQGLPHCIGWRRPKQGHHLPVGRSVMIPVPRARFVWFYLEASPGKTNRTRQNESRRKDESRRIKMNRTLQDESDESRRIRLVAFARWLPACARKSWEMRTNPHGFTPMALLRPSIFRLNSSRRDGADHKPRLRLLGWGTSWTPYSWHTPC